MPAGLDEHRLKGVHGDAVVGAVARGMRIVVAVPVALVPPVHANRIPACMQRRSLSSQHKHMVVHATAC